MIRVLCMLVVDLIVSLRAMERVLFLRTNLLPINYQLSERASHPHNLMGVYMIEFVIELKFSFMNF